MDGAPSLGSVGAIVSQAQFRVQYAAKALQEQRVVAQDQGTAVLKLIRASTVGDSAQVHSLDLRA